MDLIKEPNPPFPVEIIDTKPVEVENPFSKQKVKLQPTAVAVYDCIKGAEMLGQSTLTGSLEIGKKADFVIIDQDLLQLEATDNSHKISDTKILATWFDGKEIYSSGDN